VQRRILAVDIGNTQVCIGCFEGSALRRSWRIRTDPKETEDELTVTLLQLMRTSGVETGQVTGAIVASVVPPLTETMIACLRSLFGAEVLNVGPGIRTGIAVKLENPREVGADRIVNAVAAARTYPGGSIVVDTGTATTFDCISPRDEYLGGVIAPGIAISSEALFIRAAKLPKIEIVRPASCLGTSTVESMQAGIYFGYAGLIDGVVGQLRSELSFAPKVIATGGYARLLSAGCRSIDVVDADLTLQGLLMLFEMNTAGGDGAAAAAREDGCTSSRR